VAWETRAHSGGRYYTRSRKVGARVVRSYVGTGAKGEAAAAEDARLRAERAERAARVVAERRRLQALDEQVAAVTAATLALVRERLAVAGYRQHHRGEWRKQRGAEAV
jgi:hypothetical protein